MDSGYPPPQHQHHYQNQQGYQDSPFVQAPYQQQTSTPYLQQQPYEDEPFLEPPRAPYSNSNRASSMDSGVSSPANSTPYLVPKEGGGDRGYGGTYGGDKGNQYGGAYASNMSSKKSHRGRNWAIALGVLVLVAAAVVLPVYFLVIRPNQDNNNSSTNGTNTDGDSDGSNSPGGPKVAITGGDGTEITMADGSTFIYKNEFGGQWHYDPSDPFNMEARPNDWTPPLNEKWVWGRDRVYGVNLGGLFVLEPFISPAPFQKYAPGATDEWTLSEAMAADTGPGGGLEAQMEEHYKTFITEEDIAMIAGAGLNWIRLPVPFWAIDTWPGEPFLAKTCWKYIVQVLEWARKYGIRVNLDLHTIPGSQNGYNHSGKGGKINFLNGAMGLANAQRALNYIRIFAEFISQPQYKDLVPMFGIMNEALFSTIGKDQLTSFYLEVHRIFREEIAGYGEGNGPYISIHDGFDGISSWAGFLPNSDRFVMDTHPYFAFGEGANNEPVATGFGDEAGGKWPAQACNAWGRSTNNSRSAFGVTVAGEFSNGYNDCGLFLKGAREYQPNFGDCTLFQDASLWNETTKAGIQAFAEASMDALGDFFFWTWKIGNAQSGRIESPLWSYRQGLEEGWMPKDPRKVSGKCEAIGAATSAFDGVYQPWMTGGPGAGEIAADVKASFPWPPTSIRNVVGGGGVDSLPTYTATGTINTLPPYTPAATATNAVDYGDGWFNDEDKTPAPTPIAGCEYPDAYDAIDAAPSRC